MRSAADVAYDLRQLRERFAALLPQAQSYPYLLRRLSQELEVLEAELAELEAGPPPAPTAYQHGRCVAERVAKGAAPPPVPLPIPAPGPQPLPTPPLPTPSPAPKPARASNVKARRARRRPASSLSPYTAPPRPERVKVREPICEHCGDYGEPLGLHQGRLACIGCLAELTFGVIPGPEILSGARHVPGGVTVRRRGREPGVLAEDGVPGPRHCRGTSGLWDNVVAALEEG